MNAPPFASAPARAGLRLALAVVCCAAAGAVWGQPGIPLNRLVGLAERNFSHAVCHQLQVDRPLGGTLLGGDTFVHPTVVAGTRDCLVYLEETRADRRDYLKTFGRLPGVRAVELRFDDAGRVVSRELFKEIADLAMVGGPITSRDDPPGIAFTYRDTASPKGRTTEIAYKAATKSFEMLQGSSKQGKPTTQPAAAWQVTRQEGGVLAIESGPAGTPATRCLRRYELRAAADGEDALEIAAVVAAEFGPAWSHRFELVLPLPLTPDQASKLRASLLREDLGKVVRCTEGMLFLPVPVPVAGGRQKLDDHDFAGLALHLDHLELTVLARWLDRLIDSARALEQEAPSGVGGKEAAKHHETLDRDLALARLFARTLRTDMLDRRVVDGIEDTHAGMSTLVFQFSHRFEGTDCMVAYAPGAGRVLLSRGTSRWSTSDSQPLQFKTSPSRSSFALRLEETDPLSLTADQRGTLLQALAAELGQPSLRDAAVIDQPPPGSLNLALGASGEGVDGLPSVRVLGAGLDRDRRLLVNLSAADGPDSFSLIKTHLEQDGLPAMLDVGPLVRGMSPDSPALGRPPAPVPLPARLQVRKSFRQVAASQPVEVLAVLAPEVFDRLAKDEVTLLVCYPDENIGRHEVRLDREHPEARVTVAAPTESGGIVETALNYSLDGKSWQLAEDALLGLLYITD